MLSLPFTILLVRFLISFQILSYFCPGTESVEYVLKNAGIHVIVAESRKLDNILKAAPQCPDLNTIILLTEPTDTQRATTQAAGIKLLSIADVEKQVCLTLCAPQPLFSTSPCLFRVCLFRVPFLCVVKCRARPRHRSHIYRSRAISRRLCTQAERSVRQRCVSLAASVTTWLEPFV